MHLEHGSRDEPNSGRPSPQAARLGAAQLQGGAGAPALRWAVGSGGAVEFFVSSMWRRRSAARVQGQGSAEVS
jgi:hypothetical protein